jgi:hypothetical protein
MDHFFQIGMLGPPAREMLEAYTAPGYLAALEIIGSEVIPAVADL